MKQNYVKKFVTARLKGQKDCRQGVVIEQRADALIVLGESGEVYECEPEARVVPLSLMWGSAREFAMRMAALED